MCAETKSPALVLKPLHLLSVLFSKPIPIIKYESLNSKVETSTVPLEAAAGQRHTEDPTPPVQISTIVVVVCEITRTKVWGSDIETNSLLCSMHDRNAYLPIWSSLSLFFFFQQ